MDTEGERTQEVNLCVKIQSSKALRKCTFMSFLVPMEAKG